MTPTTWAPPKVKVCSRLEAWRADSPRTMQFGWIESTFGDDTCAGVMTIGDDEEAPKLWLSWRWAEIMPGVIAQEGAANIASSVCLVGDDGRPLNTLAHFREFVTLLHRLQWWRYVDLTSFRATGAGGKTVCRLKPVEEP